MLVTDKVYITGDMQPVVTTGGLILSLTSKGILAVRGKLVGDSDKANNDHAR